MLSTCPKISIVTPSYCQDRFLEEAILSVLTQDYPNIEYVIIDGGSTDRSVDIIKKYEGRLAYWVSEPDKGHIHALNKGFTETTGEIMAWLNSDDKYPPWAFSVVADIFSSFSDVEWISSVYTIKWNKKGQAAEINYRGGFNRESFFRGTNIAGRDWYARSWIQQESTFWRRSLWDRAGGNVDTSLNFDLGPDFELWARFYKYADLYGVATPLGGFRRHGDQKTAHRWDEYVAECERILQRYGGKPYGRIESILRGALWNTLGCRSLRRVPKSIRSLFTHLKILFPVKVIVWGGSEWEIITNYVF
jgi:glycosyltransferase involved in cell wall biosynthesis